MGQTLPRTQVKSGTLNLFSVKAKRTFLKYGMDKARAQSDVQHLKDTKLAFNELLNRVSVEKKSGGGGEREGLLAGLKSRPVDVPEEVEPVGGIELTNQSIHTMKSGQRSEPGLEFGDEILDSH